MERLQDAFDDFCKKNTPTENTSTLDTKFVQLVEAAFKVSHLCVLVLRLLFL